MRPMMDQGPPQLTFHATLCCHVYLNMLKLERTEGRVYLLAKMWEGGAPDQEKRGSVRTKMAEDGHTKSWASCQQGPISSLFPTPGLQQGDKPIAHTLTPPQPPSSDPGLLAECVLSHPILLSPCPGPNGGRRAWRRDHSDSRSADGLTPIKESTKLTHTLNFSSQHVNFLENCHNLSQYLFLPSLMGWNYSVEGPEVNSTRGSFT